jgi:hypothetical protein
MAWPETSRAVDYLNRPACIYQRSTFKLTRYPLAAPTERRPAGQESVPAERLFACLRPPCLVVVRVGGEDFGRISTRATQVITVIRLREYPVVNAFIIGNEGAHACTIILSRPGRFPRLTGLMYH